MQLPVLADACVRNVIGGSYDAATHTVAMFPQGHQVLIRLGQLGAMGERAAPAAAPARSYRSGAHRDSLGVLHLAVGTRDRDQRRRLPDASNDNQDSRWGCWPETGTQWIELDWSQPVTTNGSSVYFLDDDGVRLPASWVVQYWTGSVWAGVPNPGTYPAADNTFNAVSFDPVTTTKLRISLQSGQGSVGVIQWVVPSIPAGSGPRRALAPSSARTAAASNDPADNR